MGSLAFLQDRAWRKSVLADAFGTGFLSFLAFAAITGFVCWLVKGTDVFLSALDGDLVLFFKLLPRIGVALSVAALIWRLLPRDQISKLVGADSGLTGLVIATLAGAITPGGPSSAYALLAVLASTGANRGALVAYITAWATLGMQRILVWDVPFMGEEFAILRVLASLPLPVLAGLIAMQLPLTVTFREAGPEAGK